MALEALVADVALVHLLALVVAEDVPLEGVGPRVGLLAQVALELLQVAVLQEAACSSGTILTSHALKERTLSSYHFPLFASLIFHSLTS